MKVRALGAALAGLLAATPAFAGHEDHAAQTEAAPTAAPPCREDAASAVDRLLGSLPAQIEAIRDTEDPQERQRLLRDHLLTMEEVLHLMGRSGAGAAEGSARTDRRDAAAGERGKREGHGMMGGDRSGQRMAMHRTVEDRLDRLQKLLQQMIEHELAEEGTDVD